MNKTLITMIMMFSFAALQVNAEPRVFEGVDSTLAPPVSTAIEEDIIRQPNLDEAKKYAERNLHIEPGKVEFWKDVPGEAPSQITKQSEWNNFIVGKDKLRISSSPR